MTVRQDAPALQKKTPALRIVSPAGTESIALDQPEMTLGRNPDSAIRIDSQRVSRTQARLIREGATYRYVQVGQSNPTMCRGVPVDSMLLQPGDQLDIAPGTEHAVTLIYESAAVSLAELAMERTMAFQPGRSIGVSEKSGLARFPLPERGDVLIGRSPTADISLPSLSVSRSHARIQIEDGVVRVTDEGSANGTFVNGVNVQMQSRRLAPGDILRVGPYKMLYRDGAIEHSDDSLAVRLDVHDVTKAIAGKTILQGVSFSARPGEVTAIAGTSGAGKSTLIDALNGLRPPTSGRILVNGANLYAFFDALRPLIGYVPQQTILPAHLTLERALHYVARLRLPPDVSGVDAAVRIDEVLDQLELSDRRKVRIGHLSGGQQKRASIAAELISKPGLFFLDEPTSGLDPGLTRKVSDVIRGLAAAGSTVLMVSHDVESLMAADRVVFLARGGRVVFIGTPEEGPEYFGVKDFSEIYRRVESEDPTIWEEQLRASAQFQERLTATLVEPSPLEDKAVPQAPWDPFALVGAGIRRGSSTWRQFGFMTMRYFESMRGDRPYLALVLLQAPIIAFFLALVAGHDALQPPPPAAVETAASLNFSAAKLASVASALPLMLAASVVWFGAINASQEIVKELPIFLRERLAGLRAAPYLASKVAVLALLCALQTALLLAIVSLKADLPSSGAFTFAPLELWITLLLSTFAALGLGLVISASVPNADRATSLVPIVLIPQLIFVGGAGAHGAGRWISYVMVTHWSIEAMKVSAKIPYDVSGTGFGASELLVRWGVLILMSVVFTAVAGWQVVRRRAS